MIVETCNHSTHVCTYLNSVCLSVCLLIKLTIDNDCQDWTGMGPGTGQGLGTGSMVSEILSRKVQTGLRQIQGPGPIVSYCASPIPCAVYHAVWLSHISLLSNILTGPEHMWRWRLSSSFSSWWFPLLVWSHKIPLMQQTGMCSPQVSTNKFHKIIHLIFYDRVVSRTGFKWLILHC